MFVSKENERLYVKAWEYNAARILTELAKIVINNGGKVKPQKNAIITNRTADAAKREYWEKIERFTELEKTSHNEARANAIKTYREKLEALEKVNNEPITVTHMSYIEFVLDGFMYYYQVDENPFFPFYYTKTAIVNGRYSRDTYSMEDKKEWLYDCFFFATCNIEDVKEAANLIFNMLISSAPSQIYREVKRQRVANIYDGGYHYETVYNPGRFEKVDF